MRSVLAVVMVLATVGMASEQQKSLDPVGTYAITTTTTEGQPVKGTMTIKATPTGYAGEFSSDIIPTAPIIEVTTAADRVNVVLNAGDFLVQVRMDRQQDGTFKGFWHQLSPGIAATATKK